ncbi:uncharacterized protein LOC135834193 [Planococcus citri]|uniref:uncharacterized protein LOC135834193 n=1 Tax=Planococcus citri TaxID=170843 RepID=UPI0031F94A9B
MWINAVNRKTPKGCRTINYDNLRICSDHFRSGQPSNLHNTDDVDWVPSLRMGYQTKAEKRNDEASSTRKRWIDRQRKLEPELNETEIFSVPNPSASITVSRESAVSLDECIGTEVPEENNAVSISMDNNEIEIDNSTAQANGGASLASKNVPANSSNQIFRELKLSRSLLFSDEMFAEDEEKLKFYTGVNSMKLLQFLLKGDYLAFRSSHKTINTR